jgi:predicted PolB exonuclease-like 3'-5' exonuclease
MTRWRIFDIETVGHPDAHKWVDPITKAPGNYKNQEAIDKFIAEATAERQDRFGLDPDCCRIVALGYHDVGYSDPIVYLMRDEFEEREQLKLFWWTFDKHLTRFVTFNGIKFDLPVLLMRSLYLDVDHPEIVIAPPWKTHHVDLWNKLSLDGARDSKTIHSLSFYARRFGIGTLDKVKGSDIPKLVAEERWQEIHDHCLSDIGLTHALANRLKLLPIGVAA